MTPSLRMKFGLIALVAVMTATLAWNAAQGQIRPPHPGFNPGNPGMRRPGGIRGMNPPGGRGFDGGMGIGWRCPKCGQTGEGAIPPQTCPGCGIRFINGVGNGSAGGLRGNQAGMPPNNPGFNPPAGMPPNNPGFNPPVGDSGRPPDANLPPDNGPDFGSTVDSPNDPPQSSPKKALLIALVVGLILVGVAILAGGAFLVLHSMKQKDSTSERRRRRRPRRDDYDDD